MQGLPDLATCIFLPVRGGGRYLRRHRWQGLGAAQSIWAAITLSAALKAPLNLLTNGGGSGAFPPDFGGGSSAEEAGENADEDNEPVDGLWIPHSNLAFHDHSCRLCLPDVWLYG